jgi:general secretion pathway protein D
MSWDLKTLCLVALACAGAVVPLAGQEPEPITRSAAGIEFDFQDADFRLVVSALAEVAGLNVVFASLPPRRVTLRTSRPISEAEVRTYLETVVQGNGFSLIEEDGLLRIMADTERAGAVPGRAGARTAPGGARLYVHRLSHAEAEVLARTLATLFGFADGSAGTFDRPPASLTDQLRGQRLPAVPQPDAGIPAGAPPSPGRPMGTGLAAGIQSAVQIVPDTRTNSLLIRATPADYETIRAAITELDVRPLQVMIEVLIAEVRRDRQLGLGVDISVPDQPSGDGKVVIGGDLRGAAAGDVTLRLVGLGGIQADVVLRALATAANVNILSRPVILTENNQEARILVGSQRPFIQLFRALPTDAAVRDQIVQYRDVGTQLTIRPTINPDGYVSLAVLQEVSNATAETQFGAPIISTREARTRLLVRDGQTVVLGGLIDQQQERTVSGIPGLMRLPLLGWLFRSTQVRHGTTELFLFLTPHVLRTDADLDTVTAQVRDGTRHLRGALRGVEPLLKADSLPPEGTDASRRRP